MSDSKPPSRREYEEQNPTVSFRISKEKKEELDSLVKRLKVTKKDWFESIIDEESTKCSAVFQQGMTKGEKEGFDKGFDEGFDEGYTEGYEDGKTAGYEDGKSVGYDEGYTAGYEEGRKDARQQIVAKVPCAVCGEAVDVNTGRQREELYNVIGEINGNGSAQSPPGSLECNIQHDGCSEY